MALPRPLIEPDMASSVPRRRITIVRSAVVSIHIYMYACNYCPCHPEVLRRVRLDSSGYLRMTDYKLVHYRTFVPFAGRYASSYNFGCPPTQSGWLADRADKGML